jgi:hypothetical protein
VLLLGIAVGVGWLSSRSSGERAARLAEWTAEGKRAAARTQIDGYLLDKQIPSPTMSCGPQDWVVVLAGGACSETVIHARSSKDGGEARLRPSKGAGYRWKGEFHRDIDMVLTQQQSTRFRELATRALALPDAYKAGCTGVPCLQSGFAACVDGDWRSAYGPPERLAPGDRREPGAELWPEALAILQVETVLDPDDYVICM